MKEVINFDIKKEWIVAGKKVSINKIESTTYNMEEELTKKRIRFDELDPKNAITNVISNVGQLPTGSFLEKDKDTIIARINDVVDSSLIRTNWEIPAKVFNAIVVTLQVSKNLGEHLFYVTSKIA
ncbi:hypothetical protein [Tenacibaculum sp.]|uniref:hypothetical protein n=1 Tax=Tenacibaculum sp. TaxID=1906242 RepID=UPI003D0A61AB